MRPAISGWAATLALAALLLAPQGAAAEAPRLGLSLDGRNWSTGVERPLFAADRPLVPGDEEAVTVWVRNSSSETARLSLQLADVRGDLRLGSQLALSARIGPTAVALDGTRPALVMPADLAGPTAVHLTARLLDGVGNDAQQRTLSFRLRVTLTAEPGPAVTSASPGASALPGTGGPSLGWALLGGALVVTAAGVLRRRRGEVIR